MQMDSILGIQRGVILHQDWERAKTEAVWYAGKGDTQVAYWYFEKDEPWDNTAGL